jgi:hypothetical protein
MHWPHLHLALPLLQSFLTRALLPLHKPKCLPAYHQQLAYCVTQVRGWEGRPRRGREEMRAWPEGLMASGWCGSSARIVADVRSTCVSTASRAAWHD